MASFFIVVASSHRTPALVYIYLFTMNLKITLNMTSQTSLFFLLPPPTKKAHSLLQLLANNLKEPWWPTPTRLANARAKCQELEILSRESERERKILYFTSCQIKMSPLIHCTRAIHTLYIIFLCFSRSLPMCQYLKRTKPTLSCESHKTYGFINKRWKKNCFSNLLPPQPSALLQSRFSDKSIP